jgi:hypothetical protein
MTFAITTTQPVKVELLAILDIYCVVEPWPGTRVGETTDEYMFYVKNTGKPYTPRIKAWLDRQYPQGYRIERLEWIEPMEA